MSISNRCIYSTLKELYRFRILWLHSSKNSATSRYRLCIVLQLIPIYFSRVELHYQKQTMDRCCAVSQRTSPGLVNSVRATWSHIAAAVCGNYYTHKWWPINSQFCRLKLWRYQKICAILGHCMWV